MKIYYFLNDVSKDDFLYFLDKIDLLKNWISTDYIIDNYFYKVWEKNGKDTINKWFFVEALKFIDFLSYKYKENNKSILKKIVWVNNNINFFIYNNSIYLHKIWNKNLWYKKVNYWYDTYFVTSRDWWLNPFFLSLYKLSNINKKLHIIRPNKREWWIYNDDKINNIIKIFDKKEDLVWSFIIPYIVDLNYNSVYVFLKEIEKKLWRYVVFKKNASQFWNWIKMVDIKNYLNWNNYNFLYNNYIKTNIWSNFSFYIVPYYHIYKEYRVYFTFDKIKNKVKIFTIKNRKNKEEWNIFLNTSSNYTINKDVNVHRSHYKEWKEIIDKKIYGFIEKITKRLNYDKWVIEIISLKNWKLIFSEYNSLWWALMFKDDTEKMKEYYFNIWKLSHNNLT